jgi:hypothetical protein
LSTQFNAISQIDPRGSQALVSFLRQHGETRGYTNYWVAYPLAFLSHEDLIFAPRLPYHQDFRYTARDDRYAPYTQAVSRAGRTAFITTHHPGLDQRIRQELSGSGVEWKETQIGDYRVFYALSRKVLIQDMRLEAPSDEIEQVME